MAVAVACSDGIADPAVLQHPGRLPTHQATADREQWGEQGSAGRVRGCVLLTRGTATKVSSVYKPERVYECCTIAHSHVPTDETLLSTLLCLVLLNPTSANFAVPEAVSRMLGDLTAGGAQAGVVVVECKLAS